MIQLPERFPINFCDSHGPDKDLLSPNDQKLLTKIQYATQKDIDHLLGQLKNAQRKMSSLMDHERASILRKVSAQIEADAEKLAWLISSEGGKPRKDARAEVARAKITFDLCAEEAMRIGGEVLPMERSEAGKDRLAFTLREAIGPVLAISAFNHPLNLLAHQVGSAVASGCTVVIKPAPATPLNAFKLEKYFLEAGLPAECLFVINGEVPEIEKLASSSEFSYVSFIGSAKVGWNLRKVIAPGVRLALEHGGQAPAIVREDADIKAASTALIKGSFYHAGQVCISTQRIFIHESCYEEFKAEFSEAAKKLKVGDAREEDTDIGPLIRSQEVERIQSWIREAQDQGAKVILGNEVSGNNNQYLSPTILTHTPYDCKVMTEEVFGPVVNLHSYSDEKEILKYLNQNDYVFESCLFTKDVGHALKIAKSFSTMTMVINDHNAYRVDWMPFGGHKKSGLGMGGVKYSIEEMTRLKQIIIKL
jgi:acyl-CoA reductase-like NAD-dependent aldehyde dehydrogenase